MRDRVVVSGLWAEPGVIRARASPRELEIIELVALGLSDKEIARQLGMAQRTERTHIERLFDKFQVHRRSALVTVAMSAQPRSHQ